MRTPVADRVVIGELASAFAMASAMLGFSATAMMQSIYTRQRFFFARRTTLLRTALLAAGSCCSACRQYNALQS